LAQALDRLCMPRARDVINPVDNPVDASRVRRDPPGAIGTQTQRARRAAPLPR
jgi:hypothetical protein